MVKAGWNINSQFPSLIIDRLNRYERLQIDSPINEQPEEQSCYMRTLYKAYLSVTPADTQVEWHTFTHSLLDSSSVMQMATFDPVWNDPPATQTLPSTAEQPLLQSFKLLHRFAWLIACPLPFDRVHLGGCESFVSNSKVNLWTCSLRCKRKSNWIYLMADV